MLDLLDYLKNKFCEKRAKQFVNRFYIDPVIDSFIKDCQQLLADNPPVTMTTAVSGLAVRLSGGENVSLTPVPAMASYRPVDTPVIQVTHLSRGGDMEPSSSVPVTGKN